jgi:hypothetical protein
MKNALQKLIGAVDPEFPDGIPATDATLISVAVDDTATEWETWTGTRYPTLDSVPWQARESAVEVAASK